MFFFETAVCAIAPSRDMVLMFLFPLPAALAFVCACSEIDACFCLFSIRALLCMACSGCRLTPEDLLFVYVSV